MTRPNRPRLRIRVVFPDARRIGPGKIDLLRAIGETQSISAAARRLEMSYRRAWMLLDETRQILKTDVIETHIGGTDRGGAQLTEVGRALIGCYERLCAAAERAAAGEIKVMQGLSPRNRSRAKLTK